MWPTDSEASFAAATARAIAQAVASTSSRLFETAKHLFTLMDLSRRLIGIEDPAERLHVLCQLVIRDDFHGNLAMALRLRKGGALTMLSGPHRPPHMPNDEGIRTLRHALQEVRDKNIQMIPIWTISHNAAEAIANAAKELGVDTVLVGATRRSAFYHMLRGHVVKGLMNRLPHNCHLMICN